MISPFLGFKITLGLLPQVLHSHDVAVKGPDANNRFLSVKCKQCTGVLLVGYEPNSNVLLFVDARFGSVPSSSSSSGLQMERAFHSFTQLSTPPRRKNKISANAFLLRSRDQNSDVLLTINSKFMHALRAYTIAFTHSLTAEGNIMDTVLEVHYPQII